ncbi:MAG: hypothetical protein UH850_14615 [Paludibacteraceae bacterium]|nr:hypothetical protein [Paludibacteraceae bacterium]
MRDYAVDDYGLLLTEKTMKMIASIVCDDFEDMEEDDYGYDLYDKGICEYIGDFTGEAFRITDDGYHEYGKSEESYRGDQIFYIPICSYSTLFKPAYENMDELIAEFKEKVSEYLSDDFNYRANIRHIVGTYFG